MDNQMRFKEFIKETAAGGSIGAGSIAANPSGDSRREIRSKEHEWRSHSSNAEEKERAAKQERYHAHARKTLKDLKNKKKKGFGSWLFRRTNEDFDMSDIVSRLKGSDVETAGNDVGVVSYGVEDDKGNTMRVTVRSDQAKDFEETIAKALADNKTNRINGFNINGNSLAELLYNLRDKFEIISVEFPTIPSDVMYNADLASDKAAPDLIDDTDQFTLDDTSDMGMDDTGMEDCGIVTGKQIGRAHV